MIEPGRQVVILMADDDPGQLNLTRRSLLRNRVACDFYTVSDGAEAMEFLTQTGEYSDPEAAPRPDLILLDLNMPKLSGKEVLARLRATPSLCEIPVIMLTTSTVQTDVWACYEAGCNCYLKKPVDVKDFMQMIGQIGEFWLQLVVLPSRDQSASVHKV